MKSIILFVLASFCYLLTYGQDKKTIDLIPFLIENEDQDTLIIENATVLVKDNWVVSDTSRFIVNSYLVFKNCDFQKAYFINFDFKKNIVLTHCSGTLDFRYSNILDLSYYGNDISLSVLAGRVNNLYLVGNEINIEAISSVFDNGLLLDSRKSSSSLFLLDCTFNSKFNPIEIESSQNKKKGVEQIFKKDSLVNGRANYYYPYTFYVTGKWDRITVRESIFNSQNSSNNITFIDQVQAASLNIKKSVFHNSLFINKSSFSNRFHFINNDFSKYMAIGDVIFPDNEIIFDWDQLKEGIAGLGEYEIEWGFDASTPRLIYPYFEGDIENYIFPYFALNKVELADSYNYKKIVRSLKSLSNHYDSQGDRESFNFAYVEMQDIMLRRQAFLYEQNGGFRDLFRLRLSQIMKIYTNHGTDPSLAIVISFYVILGFAFFYLFFPSEWDVTSKGRLIKDFKEFRSKNEKGYAKPFLYMSGGIVVSILNALTLSLNAFTTLGFGRIPASGLAKYVCILQGFIGWFLLSIFTVALINQVLA